MAEKRVMGFILSSLFIFTILLSSSHAGENFYENNYLYPIEQKVSIDPKILGYCMAQRAQQYRGGIVLENHQQDFQSLFSYLVGSKDIEYGSGQETELRKWVLSQKDNSIDPLGIFSKGLELNNGDVFLTLLTIYQLLRNEARFDSDYILYDSSIESRAAFFNKFVDIRGDLEERKMSLPLNHGDHAGGWYRIWGMMLYQLNKSLKSQDGSNGSDPACEVSRFLWVHQVQGYAIASLAEWIKFLLPSYAEPDLGKASLNRAASDTMIYFLKALKKHELARCDSQNYLIEDHGYEQQENPRKRAIRYHPQRSN